MKIRALVLLAACLAACNQSTGPNLRPALDSISGDSMLKNIRVLASDEFEGRAPASPGEEKTIQFLVQQFTAMGLQPGNPDGTYIQKVPLVGVSSQAESSITAGGKKMDLKSRDSFLAISRRFTDTVKVANTDVVFVGYGVVAPEYGWDDYKGLDVKGKTILMLVNDPPVADPNDPSKLDEKTFRGKAMTYYGRWTYKYEIASEKGAAAAIIVHETGPAGYPFSVVRDSWGQENFEIQRKDGNVGRVAVEGWIPFDQAAELCRLGGQDLAALKKAAATKDFKPVVLNAKASFTVKNKIREVNSRNVIGKLDGSDPQLKNEYVVYTAHWDHLGRDTSLKGDQIFNGALDNASGTAALLEIAKAYTMLPAKPKRTMLFISVTGEEQGLLGAAYYAQNPLYPLNKTLAEINMDGMNTYGRTKDMEIVGLGNSTLDDVAQTVAASQRRVLKPDSEPEKGFYFRSDHFEFAKLGVPALDPGSGTDYIGKPAGWGQQKRDEYTAKDYHKPSDEVKPDWDMSGAVEDAQLLFQVGFQVAQGTVWPEWKPGVEFKAKRDAMLKK